MNLLRRCELNKIILRIPVGMEDECAPPWPPVDMNNFGQVGSSGVHWQQHSCRFAISEKRIVPAEIRS